MKKEENSRLPKKRVFISAVPERIKFFLRKKAPLFFPFYFRLFRLGDCLRKKVFWKKQSANFLPLGERAKERKESFFLQRAAKPTDLGIRRVVIVVFFPSFVETTQPKQRTFSKLPTELLCRNVFTKHRLSIQISAKRAKKTCMQCVHIPAELPFCIPPLVVGKVSLEP